MTYEYNELNKKIGKYFDGELHTVNNGDDIVSSNGIALLNEALLEVGLMPIPEHASAKDVGWALKKAKKNPLDLGIQVAQSNGIDMSTLDKSGRPLSVRLDTIQRASVTSADPVRFDLRRNLEWWNGRYTFRSGSSCWWSNDGGDNIYRDSTSIGTKSGNGFAIRLFYGKGEIPPNVSRNHNLQKENHEWHGSYTDRGRAWVIPVKLGYIVFNYYDRSGVYQDQQYAQLLVTLLTEVDGKDGGWETISCKTKGVNGMYLNSTHGVLVYNDKDEAEAKRVARDTLFLAEEVKHLRTKLCCAGCGERFPNAMWHESSLEPGAQEVCEDCFNKEPDEPTVEVDKRMRTGRNRNVDATVVMSALGSAVKCAVTGKNIDPNEAIDVSNVEVVSALGDYTAKKHKPGSMCSASIFNYYYQFNPDGSIRRRFSSEINKPRKALRTVVFGNVGDLKKIYGSTIGRIQKGVSKTPLKISENRRINRQRVVVSMAQANQLWLSLDWAL